MKWRVSISSILFLILVGCVTSQPMVSMDKGVSLEGYAAILVPTVSNETGQEYEFDVAETLTQKIKEEFKKKNLKVEDHQATEKTLIVKSTLLSYEPGNAFKRWLAPGYGKTQATVRTLLVDKKTNDVLGEFISSDAVSAGGLYSAGADKSILTAIAEGIAEEVYKLITTK